MWLLYALLVLALGAATMGCNDDDDDDLIGTTERLEAELAPLIAVDASGRVDFDEGPGTINDRLEAEIEVDASDFGDLGIDDNGFTDEDVVLTVFRGANQVFQDDLEFSEDRRVGGVGDITFELELLGFDVPELSAGDRVDVTVNGVLALRGTFVQD